jgi:anaphase-promoting complex subunit 5
MTRFLTPSKVGLLALIELYAEAAVPTTSTIPILSFILGQLLPSIINSQSRSSSSLESLPFLLDLHAFETLLAAHPSAAGLPGRTLWDKFLEKLWGIDSLDALHEFFATRTFLLAKSPEEIKKDGELGIPPPSQDMILLSRTSPLGSFVRRAMVEFDRLRFSDALALWIAFAKWRQESKVYWIRRNGALGRWAGDKALEKGEEDWGPEATEMLELVAYENNLDGVDDGGVSTDDVEKLLEFQVEQLQGEFLDPLACPKYLRFQNLVTGYHTRLGISSRVYFRVALRYQACHITRSKLCIFYHKRVLANLSIAFLMPGELATTLHPLIIFTDTLITQCRTETGFSTNMPS